MPSTVVHLAFAGMIAAALLGDAFDSRALLFVFALTALPDLDSVIALVSPVGHRAALHNVFVPAVLALGIVVDTRIRDRSWLRSTFEGAGVRVAWVGVGCLAVAGIGLDLFSVQGANPFWPLVDQFFVVDGKLELSTQRGIVQTFVDLSPDGGVPQPTALGNTSEVTVTTGVDPAPPADDGPVDRIFPIARAGWQLLLLLVGTGVTAARFAVPGDSRRDD